MKVLITDRKSREDQRYSDELQVNSNVTFLSGGRWQGADIQLTDFDIVFEHDTLSPCPSDVLSPVELSNITLIKLGRGGDLRNRLREPEGYRFRAEIERPSQANFVLTIIDKTEITLDDVMMILDFDPELEKLLTPFADANPFIANDALKQAKMDLNNYVKALK